MEKNKKHITSIGGSAVIEGVMMRGPRQIATAVRKPDGEIVIDTKEINPLVTKLKLNKIPIVRGVFAFFDSLFTSFSALMYSAEFYDIEADEGEKSSKFESWLEEKLGDRLRSVIITISVIISLVFSVGLFIMLPTVLTGVLNRVVESGFLKTLIEGLVRIAIFLGYIWAVSLYPDIKRVFQYHGAEHKTIFAYENGLELNVENVRAQKRFHPRCGTSFLVLVMLVSIVVFSFITWSNVWSRMLFRLLLLPLVAGISYEIIKLAGKSENACLSALSAPGLWLQKITTQEPDDSQIEVAIASMKAVIPENKEEDKW